MTGHFAIVLHAHLPFVRHPGHEKFLEESWLYEAITECYLPLIQVMQGWQRDNVPGRITMTLSPTLCSMLGDALLRERYDRHLRDLQTLAERETHRTHWEKQLKPVAEMYQARFASLRQTYDALGGNLITAFKNLQDAGHLEIITTAATHAILPMLIDQPGCLHGQIATACEHHHGWFGRPPEGIWLPECAYTPAIEAPLAKENLRWFLLDAHAIVNAKPKPQYGIFAPVFTPHGIAAFGRDQESARQVWSRDEGYPGDPEYRDFYRDIGFDLDWDYVRPFLPSPIVRGFTGIKYHRITAREGAKEPYRREATLQRVEEHAEHFVQARIAQFQRIAGAMDHAPFIVSPYDAELFGHWWYEGPEFLDCVVRKMCSDQTRFALSTPGAFLKGRPSMQLASPAPSSWGDQGHLKVWLHESNQWILPHLKVAQARMIELANTHVTPNALMRHALNQAARELLLAQSSDWPFIIRTGTSPEYATRRVKDHLLRFIKLYEQLQARKVDEGELARMEALDNLFPDIDYRHWRKP